MLSLPESWELPLCKDWNLFLETQQHQEILPAVLPLGQDKGVTLPDLDDCCFPEGKTKAAMTTITLEHFKVCTSSCGSHHLLHLPLPESQMFTGAAPSAPEEVEANSQGQGWPWHPWTAAWCPEDRGWGSGCYCTTSEVQIQQPQTPSCSAEWQSTCDARTLKPRVPEREVGRWFWLSQDQTLHPVQLTITVKAPRRFLGLPPYVPGLQRPQLMAERLPTKSMSKLQWAQPPHSNVP